MRIIFDWWFCVSVVIDFEKILVDIERLNGFEEFVFKLFATLT